MNEPSILWHDYETWGVNPRTDWPCQFAAIRTNLELQPIAKPINWLCQIPSDQLPNPMACLITGITPQHTLRDGYIEAEFVNRIHAEMSRPNTCVSGYNSIRFDDEVSRFAFYRNFLDPYAREWQNGNSRWDIIDLVRACFALRPEGIEWPVKEDGSPSFKLEDLSAANGLAHSTAHDALSDVEATIALAALIKAKQPKLFEYALALRTKKTVLSRLHVHQLQPCIHISGMYKASQGCCSIVLPVAIHPQNPNAVISVNLLHPIDALMESDPEKIKYKLYASSEDLASPNERPGLKLIHTNKSPFIAPLSTLSTDRADALGIDVNFAMLQAKRVIEAQDQFQIWIDVFEGDNLVSKAVDIDESLYNDGFLTNEQNRWRQRVLETPVPLLHELEMSAPSPQLKAKLFRFRARNFPDTLTAEEIERWQQFRKDKFSGFGSTSGQTLETYARDIELLSEEYRNDTNKQAILRALIAYAQNL